MENSELCAGLRNRENWAFELLYSQHHRWLLKAIARYLYPYSSYAEDVLQEVFLEVFDSIEQLQDDEKIAGWLRTIAHHLSLDKLRKLSVRRHLELFSLDEYDDGLPVICLKKSNDYTRLSRFLFKNNFFDKDTPEEKFLEYEESEKLSELLNKKFAKLPALTQTFLILRFHNGCRLKKIAEMFGINLETVKVSVFRGLHKLQKAIASDPVLNKVPPRKMVQYFI